MRTLRIFVTALLTMLLLACAAPGRIGGEGPAFERTGRFAVLLRSVGAADQAVQGGFAWRDSGDTLRLDLLNPMGSVLARIRVRPGQAVLERADGTREQAANPDALLAQVWGEAIPVAGLRAWIQGEPWAGSPVASVQRDDQQHITALVQNDWSLRLSDYDDQGPRRVRLTRDQGGQHLSLQLIIDQ